MGVRKKMKENLAQPLAWKEAMSEVRKVYWQQQQLSQRSISDRDLVHLKIAQAIQQVQVQSTSTKEVAEANLKLEITTDLRMFQNENITGYINMSQNWLATFQDIM